MADGIRTVSLTLRLDKAHRMSPDTAVVIRAGEADGTTLNISVKNGGVTETVSTGTKCYLCIPMPEDESMELECSTFGNDYTVTLPAAAGAVAGTKTNCYLKFVNTSNETIATTESFVIRVLEGAGDIDYDISEFEPYLTLKQAIADANTATTAANTAASSATSAAADATAAAALVTQPELFVYASENGVVGIGIRGGE